LAAVAIKSYQANGLRTYQTMDYWPKSPLRVYTCTARYRLLTRPD